MKRSESPSITIETPIAIGTLLYTESISDSEEETYSDRLIIEDEIFENFKIHK